MLITTTNLSKVFRSSTVETTAVNDVNITVNAGEFVSLMGPSGCGKSTLLHILGLIDAPTGGSYKFLGTEVANLSEKKRAQFRKMNIGFIFQNFNLLEQLTVYENVELPLIYQGISTSKRREAVHTVLEKLAITHRKAHYPTQLSGGQQQRVAVARAIVTSPKIILADEPTGNLDSSNGAEVMAILGELNKEGSTILMVTHSERDAKCSNRIIRVLDGKIVSQEGSAAHSQNSTHEEQVVERV